VAQIVLLPGNSELHSVYESAFAESGKTFHISDSVEDCVRHIEGEMDTPDLIIAYYTGIHQMDRASGRVPDILNPIPKIMVSTTEQYDRMPLEMKDRLNIVGYVRPDAEFLEQKLRDAAALFYAHRGRDVTMLRLIIGAAAEKRDTALDESRSRPDGTNPQA